MPFGLVTGRFAGADPADKGSFRGLLQAYGLPTRVSEKNPPGAGLAGFVVEPPANRSALFRGRPNRAEGGSSSTALCWVFLARTPGLRP